jgi:Asp/Glu/hydantoin racemase
MTVIAVVNCNTSTSMTETIAAGARAAALPGTHILPLTPDWGVASAEGWFDSYLSAAAVLDLLQRLDQPVDGVVMAGFGEHGREGARELPNVPVVDITEAAALHALVLGHRYAVVTTLARAGMSGLDTRMTEQLGIPVIDGVSCAVGLLETLIHRNLTTSKTGTYATPLPKLRTLPTARAGLTQTYLH